MRIHVFWTSALCVVVGDRIVAIQDFNHSNIPSLGTGLYNSILDNLTCIIVEDSAYKDACHITYNLIVGERPLHGSSEEVCDLVESFGILYHYSSDRHYQRQWTTTNWSGCTQFLRRWRWWRLRFYTQKHWRTCTLCDDKPVCQALPALPRELLPMNFGYP